MPLATTAGTYSLSFFGLTYIGLYNPSPTASMYSDSGSLIILENNTTTKRLRGNFNFVAKTMPGGPVLADVNITEGYFSVTYK